MKKNIICYIIISALLIITYSTGLAQAHPGNYGEIRGYTVVMVNSVDLENEAILYEKPDETSEIIGQFCNSSSGALLEVDETGEWAKVQINKYIGYIKTADLSPLDGSYAPYPVDNVAYLDGYNYVWSDEMPKDIQAAFTSEIWEGYHSVVGAIAANGCKVAAVVMKKDDVNRLCFLKRSQLGWEVTTICPKAIYQGDWLPEKLAFSLFVDSLYISYPPTESKYHESYSFLLKERDDYFFLQYAYTPYAYDDPIEGELSYGTDALSVKFLQEGQLLVTTEISFIVIDEHTVQYNEDDLLADNFDLECFVESIFTDEIETINNRKGLLQNSPFL